MPIITWIAGNPDSIRTTATWLRISLQSRLYDSGTGVYRARTDAEAGWQGETSDAFQARMTAGGRGIDALAEDVGTLSHSFDTYADALHTAQAGMHRARDIAAQAGLLLTPTTILEPGPAPAPAPASALPIDGSSASQMLAAYNQTVQADLDYATKSAAYRAAREEADRASSILDQARHTVEGIWDDLTNKPYLHAADFTNGVAGELVGIQRRVLKAEATVRTAEAAKYEENYRNSLGGSEQARFNEQARSTNTMERYAAERRAEDLGRMSGKVFGAGLGIAAVGVGIDIANGKPPGKAIFAGAVGTAGAIAADVAVGAAVAGMGTVTVIGAPVVAAISVGILGGIAANAAWDEFVPDSVKHKIDHGLSNAGHKIADIV